MSFPVNNILLIIMMMTILIIIGTIKQKILEGNCKSCAEMDVYLFESFVILV